MDIASWRELAFKELAKLTESSELSSQYQLTADYKNAQINKSIEIDCLLCWVLKKNKAYLRAFATTILKNEEIITLNNSLSQLLAGKPLAYIIGEKDFWDMTLKVNEHTLIPRAETETLLEVLQTLYAKTEAFSVIDLGTGSGAIAIAITRIFPLAKVCAVDISADALEIAKFNAQQWAKSNINFYKNNWLTDINQEFDCIVTNPPYIAANDEHLTNLSFEPNTALIADDNGLADIRIIIEQAEQRLKSNGYLLIEHGYQQGQGVRNIFTERFTENQKQVWSEPKIIKDLSNNDRLTYVKKC